MKITIDLPDYDPYKGIYLHWEPGYRISVIEDQDGAIILSANREGMISLANDLLFLSNPNVPEYRHIHLDSYGGLEDGSRELIIYKQK